MKRITSAFIAVLLTLTLLAGMVPLSVSAAVTDDAVGGPIAGCEGSGTSLDPVIVEDGDQFKEAMTYDGELYVQVGKSIKYSGEGYDFARKFIDVTGDIHLDLNGKEVQKFEQIGGAMADGRLRNTMIAVKGTLTVDDSSKKQNGQLCNYSHISDLIDWIIPCEDALENIIRVDKGGKFILNGGNLVGGRSQKHWCASAFVASYDPGKKVKVKKGITDRYDGNGRIQNNGTALIVGEGGEAIINGGRLYGRGWSSFDWDGYDADDTYFTCGKMEAAVETRSGSKLTVYDGLFEGTNANIFNYKGGDVNIYGGEFNPRKLDRVIVGACDRSADVHVPYRVVIKGQYGELGLPESAFAKAYDRGGVLLDSKDNVVTDYEERSTDGSTLYLEPKSPHAELNIEFEDKKVGPSGMIEWSEGSNRMLHAIGGNDYFPEDAPSALTDKLQNYYEWVIYDTSETYADGKKNQYGFNSDYCVITVAGPDLDLAWLDLDKIDHTSAFRFKPGHEYRVLCRQVLDFRGENSFHVETPIAECADLFYIPKMDIPKVVAGYINSTWTHVYGDKTIYDVNFTVSRMGSAETEVRMAKIESNGSYHVLCDKPGIEWVQPVTKNGVQHAEFADYEGALVPGEMNKIVMLVTTVNEDGLRFTGESVLSLYVPDWATTSTDSYNEPGEMALLTTIPLANSQYIHLYPNVNTDIIKGFEWILDNKDLSSVPFAIRNNDMFDDNNMYVSGLQPGKYHFVGYYDKARTQRAYTGATIQIVSAEDGGYAYIASDSREITRNNPAHLTAEFSIVGQPQSYSWYYYGENNEKVPIPGDSYQLTFPNNDFSLSGFKTGDYRIGCDMTTKSGVVTFEPLSVYYENVPTGLSIYYQLDGKELRSQPFYFDSEDGVGKLYIKHSPKDSVYHAIAWGSYDENIVTVEQDGTITAHHPGTTKIWAGIRDIDGSLKYAYTDVYVPVSTIDVYVKAPVFSDKIDANNITVENSPYYGMMQNYFNNPHWIVDGANFPATRYFEANSSITSSAIVQVKDDLTLPLTKKAVLEWSSYVVQTGDADESKIKARIHLDDGSVVETDEIELFDAYPRQACHVNYTFPVLRNNNHSYLNDLDFRFDTPANGVTAGDVPQYFSEKSGAVWLEWGEAFDVTDPGNRRHVDEDDTLQNGHTYRVGLNPRIKADVIDTHFGDKPNVFVNGELVAKDLIYGYGVNELEPFYYTFTVGDPDLMCSEVWLDLDNPAAGEIAPQSCDLTAPGYEVVVTKLEWSQSMLENGAFRGNTTYTATATIELSDSDENALAFFGLKNIYSNGIEGKLVSQKGRTATVRFEFPKTEPLDDYLMMLPNTRTYELPNDFTFEDLGDTTFELRNAGTSTLTDIEVVPVSEEAVQHGVFMLTENAVTLAPGESVTLSAYPAPGTPEGVYRFDFELRYKASGKSAVLSQSKSFVAYIASGGMGIETLPGDANIDGIVDITDATYVQMAAAQLLTLQPQGAINADVNNDGSVDVTDATLIQLLAAEKSPTPVPQG